MLIIKLTLIIVKKNINNNITDIGWKVINQNRLSAIVSNKRQEETETGAFSGNARVVGCTDGVGAMAQQSKALATQSLGPEFRFQHPHNKQGIL